MSTTTIELLKNYNKYKHLNIISDANIQPINLEYIQSNKWVEDKDIPYIVKTHLLDSYYCLPERPDMAFTFLWKSINNTYTELFIKKNPTSEKQILDSKSLDTLIDIVVQNFDVYINEQITIKQLIEKYIEHIPDKLTRFIANLILKNYVLEKKYYDEEKKSLGIATKHIASSYNTFKSKFKSIHNDIINTYGEAYRSISNPEIIDNVVELNITNEQKAQDILRSLGDKIKKLLIHKTITLTSSTTAQEYTLTLTNDKEYVNFIIRNILYAIRNSTVHGKIASRLNSETKNRHSYPSSIYIYLLGYMFLSIALYELDYINSSDLAVNIINLENHF